jgi:Na+-translocating ferredoxin:NAD+ oxidoreductase RnfD subunit
MSHDHQSTSANESGLRPDQRPVAAGMPMLPPVQEPATGSHLPHMIGAGFPLVAGLYFYGWRGAAVLAGVLGSTAVAVSLWRRVGRRGGLLRQGPAMWSAVLLCMMLPPHLLAGESLSWHAGALWWLVPAAGLLMGGVLWLSGGNGLSRLQPPVLVYLILWLCGGEAFAPHLVLHRSHALVGDLADAAPAARVELSPWEQPWVRQRQLSRAQAISIPETAAWQLGRYTRGQPPSHGWISLEGMVRDLMPPLEDLVIGGHPGPLGASSGIAVIVGGLFLMYRRVIGYRIPLVMVAAACVSLALLPVPVVVSESGGQWRLLLAPGSTVDLATAVAFLSYQIMGSGLLLTAFFLATRPSIHPARHGAQIIFALLAGCATAAGQLYVDCAAGAYIALLAVELIWAVLDRRLPGWDRMRAGIAEDSIKSGKSA